MSARNFVCILVAAALMLVALPGVAQVVTETCQDGRPGTSVRDETTGRELFCIPDDPSPGGGAPPPTATVTAAEPDGIERGIDDIRFLVALSAVQTTDVTVNFHLSGTATSSDYTASSTTSVTIPANQANANVVITPKGDTVSPEPEETVIITLDAGTGYAVGSPATAEGNITDVPPSTISIAATDGNATEGGAGSLGSMTFTLTRTAPTTSEQTVTVSLAAGSRATASDIIASPPLGLVTFTAGQATRAIVVAAADDGTKERIENVTLAIGTGSDYLVSATAGKASGLLYDNDVQSIQVTAFDATAAEGGEPNPGRLRITRTSLDLGQSLTVPYTIGGTATAGADYEASPTATSAVFGASQTIYDVTIMPVADDVAEGTETVTMAVAPSTAEPTSASYYQLLPTGTAVVTIIDRDVPLVTVAANPATGTEGSSQSPKFTLTRTDSATTGLRLTDPLIVAISFGGTAAASDYAVNNVNGTTTKTVTFLANKRQVNITVSVTNDATPESSETIDLSVLPDSVAPPEWGVGSPSHALVTILDNDGIDTDGDGILDTVDNCVSQANADQANQDGDAQGDVCDDDDDGDGLSDAEELAAGTDPHRTDTDGDGRSDKQEKDAGTDGKDPLSPDYRVTGVLWTATGTGVRVEWTAPTGSLATRYMVFRASTPTFLANVTAISGEVAYSFQDLAFPGGNHTYYVQAMLPGQTGTTFDPLVAVGSAEQDIALCDAFTADTDGDGLCDRLEAQLGTDPTKADTDGDGIDDGAEVAASTNPLQGPTGFRATAAGWPFWLGAVLLAGMLALAIIASVRARRPSNGRDHGT